jgi:energy-converting hydrogenase Eha subunit C
MKKLLAVLCFVPVGVLVLVFISVLPVIIGTMIHLLLTNPLSVLISMGLVAGMMLAFAAFAYGIPILIKLGARLWRGK